MVRQIGSILRLSFQFAMLCMGLCLFLLPQESPAWSEQVRRSYALEVIRNPAISLADLRSMATTVLMAREGISYLEANKRVQSMNLHETRLAAIAEFSVAYYEVPLTLLREQGLFDSDQVKDLKVNHQIFQKDGESFVRWFVHPMHSETYFKTHFSGFRMKGAFRAILTSSRSMVLKEIATGNEWSHKSSLKVAMGKFKDKIYPATTAHFHFQMSGITAADPFLQERFFSEQSFVSLDDGVFKEGQIARSLSPFDSPDRIEALAIIFDHNERLRIARQNGYGDDWKAFLAEKVLPDLGFTMGHLFEKHGLAHNSLHSQNVLMRFDAQGKFKHIMIRDPDFYVDRERFTEVHGSAELQRIRHTVEIRSHAQIEIDFSIMNGMEFPEMDRYEMLGVYRRFGVAFTTAFLQNVSRLRGGSMTAEQIAVRAQEYTRVVDSADGIAKRYAVPMEGQRVDRLLDPQDDLSDLPMDPEIRSLPPGMEGKNAVMAGLRYGSRFEEYQREAVTRIWLEMVSEFKAGKSSSHLQQVFESNDAKVIRQIIVSLNTNSGLPASEFFRVVMERHPKVFEAQSLDLFFNGHYDPELMRQYINQRPADEVSMLLHFLKSNRLMHYPQDVVNRWFVRVSDSIARQAEAYMKVQSSLPEFRQDSHFKGTAEKYVIGLQWRQRVLSSLNSKCFRSQRSAGF